MNTLIFKYPSAGSVTREDILRERIITRTDARARRAWSFSVLGIKADGEPYWDGSGECRIDGIPPTVTYDGKEWEVVV